MLKIFLLALIVCSCISANGQARNGFELSLMSRYDKHASYITNFAGRAYNDTMKLYGVSRGVSVQFRRSVSPTLSFYLGAGYHRLGVNKIKSNMPFNLTGVATARSINNEDDDSTKLGYSTSRYHYNNLAFTVGFSKLVNLNKNFVLDLGAEGVGYYSFSQGYNLMNNYHYSTSNAKPMEFGINATIGLLKEYNNFYIRPALLVPLYQNLKGDKVFFEDSNRNISKWFNGVGLTLRIGRYI